MTFFGGTRPIYRAPPFFSQWWWASMDDESDSRESSGRHDAISPSNKRWQDKRREGRIFRARPEVNAAAKKAARERPAQAVPPTRPFHPLPPISTTTQRRSLASQKPRATDRHRRSTAKNYQKTTTTTTTPQIRQIVYVHRPAHPIHGCISLDTARKITRA